MLMEDKGVAVAHMPADSTKTMAGKVELGKEGVEEA